MGEKVEKMKGVTVCVNVRVGVGNAGEAGEKTEHLILSIETLKRWTFQQPLIIFMDEFGQTVILGT